MPPDLTDPRRIKAALAACEGIETYALELMTGPLLIIRQIEHQGVKPKTKEQAKTVALRKKLDQACKDLDQARKALGVAA